MQYRTARPRYVEDLKARIAVSSILVNATTSAWAKTATTPSSPQRPFAPTFPSPTSSTTLKTRSSSMPKTQAAPPVTGIGMMRTSRRWRENLV
ncbi:MAG: hypothetical protein ACLT98_03085 [Eggerthellaceae bacterium]